MALLRETNFNIIHMVQAIKKRRAAREYLNEPIPEDKLSRIIDAAMYAPSANAIYPWELIIVTKLETREELSKVTPWSAHAKEAPAIIAVLGLEKDSPYWIEDCSIVAENIWLQATEEGLSSCWIQIRNNSNAEKEVKEILKVPEAVCVLCLMPIGVPAKPLPEHGKADFKKSKVKYDKYK
jgi:nitroreductase